MDEELMDLAGSFDDNPADALAGEVADVPAKKPKVVVQQEAVEVDAEGDEELDAEGNPVVADPLENDEADIELELDEDGNEIDPPQETPAVIAPETPVKLLVDGKEVNKTFAQVIEAAQKVEAADKRFLEAATIRKDADAKLAVLPEREKQLGQVLEYYIAQSTQFMEQKAPDWDRLIAEDPQKYLLEHRAWEKRQFELKQATDIRNELQRRNAEAEQASKAERVISERTALLAVLPEWSDPVKAAEGSKAVGKYLADAGIPAEMLSNIDHHQVIVIARKAMMYDAAIAKAKAARKPGAQSVQRAVVPTVRVERPGAATPPPTQTTRKLATREKATRAFNAAPSVDSLANLFLTND